MGMTGPRRPVEERIGRSCNTPDGNNDKPYGKCYGQVCGQSYPCTQQEYIDPRKAGYQARKDSRKKAYYKSGGRVSHNARKMRCVETGDVFASMKEASRFAGVTHGVFRKAFSMGKVSASVGGYTFEAVD